MVIQFVKARKIFIAAVSIRVMENGLIMLVLTKEEEYEGVSNWLLLVYIPKMNWSW